MTIEESKKSIVWFVSYIVAFAAMIFTWVYIYMNPTDEPPSNVTIYIIGIMLFGILFLILFLLLNRIYHNKQLQQKVVLSNRMQIFFVSAVTAIGILVFWQWYSVSVDREIGVLGPVYDCFPMNIVLLLCLVAFGIFFRLIINNADFDIALVYGVYVIIVMLVFGVLYTPNIFLEGDAIRSKPVLEGSFIAITSVTETIYNVFALEPYTWSTTGLYGHYGLFFLPLLKIVGSASNGWVILFLAIFGCIEQVACLYIINTIAVKNWQKVLFSLASVVRPLYVYPAIFPIRTLFPTIMCAYLLYLYKKEKNTGYNRYMLLGYFISVAAILWNTETGVGCLIGITVYYVWEFLGKGSKLSMKSLYSCIGLMPIVLLSALMPIAIVNIYNFFCGYRKVEFSSFLYPYIGNSWAIDALSDDVPLGNHAWIYIIALLIGCFAWALSKLLIAKSSKESAMIAGIAAIGIVAFLYYFNEAHWGCMDIVRKICSFLAVWIVVRFYPFLTFKHTDILSQLKKSLLIIAVFIFISCIVEIILLGPLLIHDRHKANIYETQKIRTWYYMDYPEGLPDNIYGVGQGIQMIYNTIGWDNYASYRDTSSLDIADIDGSYNKLSDEILQHDEFLIGNTLEWDLDLQRELLTRDCSYRLIKTFDIGYYEYAYYAR